MDETFFRQFSGIQECQMMVLSLNDDSLRKNFNLVSDNFQRIERRFDLIEEKFMNICGSQFQELRDHEKDLNLRLDNVVSSQFKIEKLITNLQNKQGQLCLSVADDQAKLIDIFNFRKTQKNINQRIKQKQDQLRAQLLESSRFLSKIEDSLMKKADKSELQKTKKEVINIMGRLDSDKSKMGQIEQKQGKLVQIVQKLNESIVQIKKKMILNQSKELAEKKQINEQIRRETIIISKQVTSSKLQEINQLKVRGTTKDRNDIDQLMVKVNRLIELQKTRERIGQRNQYSKKNQLKIVQNQHRNDSQFQKIFRLKMDQLQEKLGSQERRIQSSKFIIQTAQEKIRIESSHKIQQKFKQMQAESVSQAKHILSCIQNKLDQNQFNFFTKDLHKDLKKISDQLLLKPNKVQVKKAFQFLEAKFKQLITVVQEDDPSNCLASKRDIFRCISCDKAFQTFTKLACKGQPQKIMKKGKSLRMTTRGISNSARRPIRMVDVQDQDRF